MLSESQSGPCKRILGVRGELRARNEESMSASPDGFELGGGQSSGTIMTVGEEI
jgi:hypothetical protein